MKRGKFIVLEGVDGSGTTTHSALLAKSLKSKGFPVHRTHEPSAGPIGTMIRQVLSGRIVAQTENGAIAPSWTTMALLFAADRTDHVQCEIEPLLSRGVNVICDRYVYSSLVYQSATADHDLAEASAWIDNINAFAAKPDICLVLQVSIDVAADRRSSRAEGEELYEKAELQAKLTEGYAELEDRMPDHPIYSIDASGDIDDTVAKIHAALAEHVGAPFS